MKECFFELAKTFKLKNKGAKSANFAPKNNYLPKP
jgi:hypothetical protein